VTCDTLTVRRLVGHCLKMVPGGVDTNVMNTPAESLQTRIVDAALECVARYGVAKTTADDIAKAASCSRATLYRTYPNKQAILGAAVARELHTLETAIRASIDPAGTFEAAVCATILTVARRLDGIAALQFVLHHEPEAIMPHLAFDRADAGLAVASALGADIFATWLHADAAGRAGELVARIVLSHLTHTQIAELTDPISVQRLVHDFVVPGLTKIPTTTR
jgi:AcrR family transcriptional regulator